MMRLVGVAITALALSSCSAKYPEEIDYSSYAERVVIGRGKHGYCYIEIVGKDGRRTYSVAQGVNERRANGKNVCDLAEAWMSKEKTR